MSQRITATTIMNKLTKKKKRTMNDALRKQAPVLGVASMIGKTNNEPATRVCRCCGKELPISEFRKTKIGTMHVCKSCLTKRQIEGREKKKLEMQSEDAVKEARYTRLRDFSGRELLLELKRRGYKFSGTYTEVRTFDSEKL